MIPVRSPPADDGMERLGDGRLRDDERLVLLDLAHEGYEVVEQVVDAVEPVFHRDGGEVPLLRRVDLQTLDDVMALRPGDLVVLEEDVVVGEQREHHRGDVGHHGVAVAAAVVGVVRIGPFDSDSREYRAHALGGRKRSLDLIPLLLRQFSEVPWERIRKED